MRPLKVSPVATPSNHGRRLRFLKLSCGTPPSSSLASLSTSTVSLSTARQNDNRRFATTTTTTTTLTSSSSSSVWMEAVKNFYRVVDAHTGNHVASPARLHAAACLAMQLCLQHHRAAEALDVYVAACEEGVASDPCSVSTPLLSPPQQQQQPNTSIHRLALEALRAVPHRSRQRLVVAQLLAAEGVSADPVSPDHHHTAPITSASAAEEFRVQLQQQLAVLRATHYLKLPLGRNYLLTQAQRALEDHQLRREVEVGPLLQLSSALLWHPFSYATPGLGWARRQAQLEELAHAVSTSGMNPTQQRHVLQMEAAIAPVRRVCTHALHYLTTLAPEWDALVARRVAEVLLLPEDARSVFPADYRQQRQRARREGSVRQVLAGGAVAADAAGEAAAAAWTDKAQGLFDPPAPAHEEDSAAVGGVRALDRAMARTTRILARRVFHNIVIPDAAFVMTHFHQLLQLGKYREIVLPHGVLLELARLAATTRDPKRFHARRALHALMLQTTTGRTPRLETSHRAARRESASVATRHERQQGGVTLLGLQDELALLERCPERQLLEDTLGAAADRFDEMGPLSRARLPSASAGDLSATLVALQVGRLVAEPPSLRRPQPQQPSSPPPLLEVASSLQDVDALVSAIVQSNRPTRAETTTPSEVPLFKTRSRTYWARMPVVLATTSDSTRSIAHMMGVRMYPPVEG